MKLTVYYDGQYWVGVVEEVEDLKLSAYKHIFGVEPKAQEILDFVNTRVRNLAFKTGLELEGIKQPDKRVNPKRLARMAAREVRRNGVSTFAQEAMQAELELKKKEKKIITREQKEQARKSKCAKDVQKAKNKHRGR